MLAAAAALLLLLGRSQRPVLEAPRFDPYRFRDVTVRSIFTGRQLARQAGYERLLDELRDSEIEIERIIRRDELVDLHRSRQIGERLTRDVTRAIDTAGIDEARDLLDTRRGTIARTEAAEAFSEQRRAVLRDAEERGIAVLLYRQWNARFDNTCQVCAGAHGIIVPAGQPFPDGEPGAVHPNCQCWFDVLTPDEARIAGRV